MKKWIVFLLLFSSLSLQAQQQYVIEKNIQYHGDAVDKNDAYMHHNACWIFIIRRVQKTIQPSYGFMEVVLPAAIKNYQRR